ncbi:MAG: hypothetical protein MJZ75_03270 [Paludibacteraceae bacterium]|nr:hypothetical protein [Paludibacteraceae bacterium]
MKTKSFILLASVVVLSFSACKPSSDTGSSSDPVKLELIGTWRSESLNGERLTTNDRTIITFLSSTKMIMSLSRFLPEFQEFTWRNKAMGDYSFDGVNLVVSAADPGTKHICRAYPIDANSMTVYYDAFVNKKGVQSPMADTVVFRRISDDLGYDELILGTWEGVSNTGLETYGDYHHRWEYKDKDRSDKYDYVYYSYDSLNHEWVPSAQSVSEYNIHGSWLATRWLPQGEGLKYEWWDIDEITDSTMRWSAWRKDEVLDTAYLATFTFRRVVE